MTKPTTRTQAILISLRTDEKRLIARAAARTRQAPTTFTRSAALHLARALVEPLQEQPGATGQ